MISAIIPANKKAIGAAPFARVTVRPRTANMPPPIIPPIPIETASRRPIFFALIPFSFR